MASALNSVVTELIRRWTELPALSGVVIEDASTPSSRAWLNAVVVGDDFDPETDTESEFTQEWVDIARTRRREQGTIPCAAVAQSGSTVIGVQRQRAFEIFAACELDLTSDNTLAGIVFSVEVTEGQAKTIQNTRGSALVLPFTVQYWTHV